MASDARANRVRGVTWREKETLDLLSIWGEGEVQEALGWSHRNLEVFEEIARRMQALGHRRSATECRSKTKTMRHEYRRAAAHNSQPGSRPAACPHFKQLDRILRVEAGRRPKRLPRGLKSRWGPAAPRAPAEPAGGSEGLPPQDWTTVQRSGFSTPVDSAEMTQGVSLEDEAQLDPNSAPAAPTASQQGDNLDRGALMPLAEESAGTCLAKPKNRTHQVALLNEVAEKMLEQSKSDQAEATRLNERWMMMEEQRHRELLEEGERDRKVFQETMQQTMAVMMAAVDALKKLGEFLQDGPSTPETQDGVLPHSDPPHQASLPLAEALTERGADDAPAPGHSGSHRAAPREDARDPLAVSPSHVSSLVN